MGYAQQALQARHEGKYHEARRLFALAAEKSTGVKRADVLFNWADTVRRFPECLDEARQKLAEALEILDPIQSENPKVYAACLHHLGRLERQVGDYTRALDLIERSVWRIRVCNQKTDTPYIDTLTTLLDAASIRAICGFPWRSRLAALQAFVWTFRGMTEPVEGAHRQRALVLFVFANRPHSRIGFVRRAFFGREEKLES